MKKNKSKKYTEAELNQACKEGTEEGVLKALEEVNRNLYSKKKWAEALVKGLNRGVLKNLMENEYTKYPYAIRRLEPAVYQELPIIITQHRQAKLISGCLVAYYQDEIDRNNLTDKVKKGLVEMVKIEAQSHNYDYCLVIQPAECVYVYPDGRTTKSDFIPLGGIRLDHEGEIKEKK